MIVKISNLLEIRNEIYNKLLQIDQDRAKYAFLTQEKFIVYDDFSCNIGDIVSIVLGYFTEDSTSSVEESNSAEIN